MQIKKISEQNLFLDNSTMYTIRFKYDGLLKSLDVTISNDIAKEEHATVMLRRLEEVVKEYSEDRVKLAVNRYTKRELSSRRYGTAIPVDSAEIHGHIITEKSTIADSALIKLMGEIPKVKTMEWGDTKEPTGLDKASTLYARG